MPPSAVARPNRARNPMPSAVRAALTERGLLEAYRARPPYQRNDYLGWIARAKRPETRAKRLVQMLQELAAGDRYMNMRHTPRRTSGAGGIVFMPSRASRRTAR